MSVYLLAAGDSGMVKIGKADDPSARMATVQRPAPTITFPAGSVVISAPIRLTAGIRVQGGGA